MSKQVSNALLKIIEEMSQIEIMEMKIQGVLFTRRCTHLIQEKTSYLENLLQKEADNYSQKIAKYYVTKNYIVTSYKEKLQKLYEEYYLQYVNIQEELQDARLAQRVNMVKYQEFINQRDNELQTPEYISYINTKKMLLQKLNSTSNSSEYNELYKKISELKAPNFDNSVKRELLKKENEKYQKVINLCNKQFQVCRENFENQVNKEFFVATSLIKVENSGFINKIKNIISNIFLGAQKYTEVLENYKEIIEKIDCEKIVNKMRDETIGFVEETLIIKMNYADVIAS